MEIISSIFVVFCALILPISATVYLSSRKKGLSIPILIGAITFFVFQILIRIPLLQIVLPNTSWYLVMRLAHPLLYTLFLGVTAALVEELGRYIMMRVFINKRQSSIDGIAFGVGHGGIEAILLVGINALMMLIFARQSITPELMFANGIERVATLALHISWSVMVMKSIREKKVCWLLLALLMHAVIDSAVAYAMIQGISVFIIEGILMICAMLSTLFVIKEYKRRRS